MTNPAPSPSSQLWHRARRQPRFVGTRRQRAAVGSGRHTGDRADTRTEGAVGAETAVAAVTAPTAESQPRPPKAQETVQVRFNVRPWGDVYVNGARRGAGPRCVSLTPGVYVIEIRNGTLPPLHRTVAIDFGSKPVNIDYAFE